MLLWLASLTPEDLARELETAIGKLRVDQILETFVIWHINIHCGEGERGAGEGEGG